MSDLRIHAALSPRVAVLSSPDVDRVIQLNGIPDLPTLLRPFEFSVERLSVRTSQLETRVCDRFPLRFDPYSLFNPEAASAIGVANEQAAPAPRPEAVASSHEELLDRVNHLIGTNIKKWDAQVPRPISSDRGSAQQRHHQQHDTAEDEADGEDGGDKDRVQPLDEALAQLQRGSLEQTAPWFAAVQQLVFGQRSIAKHESFGHPVAVLLAVSSASPDPMNDFAKLYEASSQPSPFPAHPYINPDTLKYYVLIHDVHTSGNDLASSKEMLEQVKKTYGLHCCLLAINSASASRDSVPVELAALWSEYLPSTPTTTTTSPTAASPASATAGAEDVVAKMLDDEDVKRIKGFIRELTAQSIVPFMERYVQHMGDHLASSRKGLTNRLFGASRKLFGGVAGGADKGGASTGLATSGGYDAQHESYPYTSIEAQTRRLADFAFTIRDYKLAASMYDLGRKDFAGDKATRHAAGATEMFGLSHLMIMYTARSAPIDVDSYLAQACYEYDLRPPARASQVAAAVEQNHALRATLLYYEAYRMLGYLRPAAAGLLRMAQRSDEVLAPLLLEQAALSCLQVRPKPSLRKFALHLVAAAHRYQMCGQKILSLRCYALAAVVYRGKGWSLIENHIEHELGMQAYNEGDADGAVAHLIRLIRPSANSREEHERFLQDVQTAYKYSGQVGDGDEVVGHRGLELPFAMFDVTSAALSFVAESSALATSTVDEAVWDKLEQDLVQYGLQERTMPDGTTRRRKRPTSQTSTQARQVPVNQAFWLDVQVRNPLAVGLTVDEIRPVLTTTTEEAATAAQRLPSEEFSIEEEAGKIHLGPLQSRRVRVAIRVHHEYKSVRIASITFRLEEAIHVIQHLEKKGPRLNGTKQQRTAVVYGADLSLAVSVHGPRPTVTARVVDVPPQMYLGEEARLKVVLRNEGEVAVDDVRALCDQGEAASFGSTGVRGEKGDRMENMLSPAAPQAVLDNDGRTTLAPGEEVEASLLVRPVRTGEMRLAWLVAFSPADGSETYLSRMALTTHVAAALQVNVATRPAARSLRCEHDVVVEAVNLLNDKSIRLEGVSVVSPRWRLVGDERDGGEVVIAPRQVWRGRLRIACPPLETGQRDDAEEYTATRLQDLLLSRDTRRPAPTDVSLQVSTLPYSDGQTEATVDLHSTYAAARKLWRLRTLSSAFPTISARDRVAAFTLWDSRSFDLLARFSVVASQSTPPERRERRAGFTAVYGLQPGPARSGLRAITHPQQAEPGAGSKVRSLYAETVREKASLLQNMVTSGLNMDQNPVVVSTLCARAPAAPSPPAPPLASQQAEAKQQDKEKVTWVVRNFSDLYEAEVELQLHGQDGWVGRKTLRCTLKAGEAVELHAARRGDATGPVEYTVVTESFLVDDHAQAGAQRRLVGRYVERR